MTTRLCSLTLALMMFCGVIAPLRAAAQSETGLIAIAVEDAASKAPISLARVVLDGPVLTTEFSNAAGKVTFTDVPGGIYRARVFKSGFQSVTTAQFEVLNNRAVNVAVALAKSQELRTIGTVTVKSSAEISTTSISETSAVRRLSDTLTDALGKLSGVTINTDATGDSDASQTVSLEGQDPSQTALTLDGIPLNAPGTAGNLAQINSDLFSGAAVSFGPQAGALAGGVNFRTLEPTLSWQTKASAMAGSYGKSALLLSEQGSYKNLGLAYMHTVRGNPNPIDGTSYLDASGLDYAHAAGSVNDGDMLKLRYRLGSAQTLTASMLASNRESDLNCFQYTAALPCGYGPNNSSYGRFSLFSLGDTAIIGQTAVQASLYASDSRNDRDLLARVIGGNAAPTGTESRMRTRGASINAQLPARERHTITLQATTSTSRFFNTPLIASAAPYANYSTSSSFSTISILDSIRSSTKLRIGTRLGLSSSTTAGNSVIAGVNAQWQPTSRDTYAASFDVGGQGANSGRFGVLTDPQALRFNCSGAVGFGSGPGDQPGPTSSQSARASWQHRITAGLLSATLYRQVQNDTILPTQVNASALPSSYFPAGYFQLAQNVFQSQSGCGTATAFGPSNVYLTVPVGGVRRVYEGVQLTAGVQVGKSVIVQPYYNIQVAKALTADARVFNPLSVVVPGAQLPNVPLHVGGVTIDYKAPRSAIEGLLNARYSAANNGQNLPANVVLDAGVNVTLSRGNLTVAGTNVFNTFGGEFATTQNAVPLATANGTLVPTIARPNAPRQYSVTYTLPFGAGARSSPARSALAARGLAADGGPGGPGGLRSSITPLPEAPPVNPLDLDTSKPACTAENATTIAPLLAKLKGYVAQIENAKGASGYPETAPAPPELPGVTLTYHKLPQSYALTMTLTTNLQVAQSLARPFFSCAQLHVASPEQVQSRGLYQPPAAPFFRRPLIFMPAAGFYLVNTPPQPGVASFRLYRLPTTPPATPFEVRAGESCSAELKPEAQRLLAALNARFTGANAQPASSSIDGWRIVAHSTAAGAWYELQPNDTTALPALLNCGHIAAATKEEIAATGFDGAPPPGLNYTPKLGLYFIRPAPRPGSSPPPEPPPEPPAKS